MAVTRQKKRTIQIYVIAGRGEDAGRRNPQGGADHATDE